MMGSETAVPTISHGRVLAISSSSQDIPLTKKWVYDAEGSVFKVPAWKIKQKPIRFGRFKAEVKALEPLEAKKDPPEFLPAEYAYSLYNEEYEP